MRTTALLRRRVARAMWLFVGLVVVLWLTPLWGLGTAESASLVAVALSGAVVLAALVLLVARPARRGGGLASPVVQASATAEPVPVPTRIEGPVRACMRCGSLDVTMPGFRDGVALGGGELQFHVCRRCGTRAPPLEFDRAEDYVAFVEGLHRR